MSWHTVVLLMGLLYVAGCRQNDRERALEVTYIANEGFMIDMGGTKVLIDALSRSQYYLSASESTLAKLMDGIPPYHGIDHLLVTHDHPDHFDSAMVSQFLRRHPSARLISTGGICRSLAANGTPTEQCRGADLALGEHTVVQGEGAEVQVMRLPHGWNSGTGNLAFVVRSNGHTIMHVGDALLTASAEHLRKLLWDSLSVDILSPEFFDRSTETQEFIEQRIRPAVVVLMHIPPGEEESVRDAKEKVHPRTVVFMTEGEVLRFDSALLGRPAG